MLVSFIVMLISNDVNMRTYAVSQSLFVNKEFR